MDIVKLQPNTPIDTRRLRLRWFEPADVDATLAYHSMPEVAEYQYWGPRSRSEVSDKILEWSRATSLLHDGDRIVLAVELIDEGVLIGDVSLGLHSVEARQGEVGFSFHPTYLGQGYATEAARALIDWGFGEASLHRIYGRCDVRNERSWKLLERLGFRCEAHFHEHARFKGRWDEEFHYAILAREWAANKKAGH